MRTQSEIVVLGSGVIGLGIAWKAARLGAQVTVIDRSDPPRGASWAAAGMLAPLTEAHFGEERLLQLNLHSSRQYPAFLKDLRADSGISVQMVDPGTLYLALDRDQLEALERLFEFQVSLDLDVIRVSAEQARDLEPALAPSTRGGILAGGDKAIDPRELMHALEVALQKCGGEILVGEVVGLEHRQDAVRVRLSDDREIMCGRVVLATGAWSGAIEGTPDEVAAAIRPVKGQILHLRPPQGEPNIVSHVIRTEEMYLVPRHDGELICGATMEEKGFDVSVTAGAVFELMRAAIEAVPGIREFEVTETLAGLRPASLDNAPLIGPTSIEGIIAATGHYRNGILLTPATADAVANMLVQNEVPDEILPFDPRRFSSKT